MELFALRQHCFGNRRIEFGADCALAVDHDGCRESHVTKKHREIRSEQLFYMVDHFHLVELVTGRNRADNRAGSVAHRNACPHRQLDHGSRFDE